MIWNLTVTRALNSGELTVCNWVGDWLEGYVRKEVGPDWGFAELAAERPLMARECLYTIGSTLLAYQGSELCVKLMSKGHQLASSALDGHAAAEAIMARHLREDISPDGPGLAVLEVYREMPVDGLRRALAQKPETELLGVIQAAMQTH